MHRVEERLDTALPEKLQPQIRQLWMRMMAMELVIPVTIEGIQVAGAVAVSREPV